MYYRITKVNHKPGVQGEMREYLKSKSELMKTITGLQSVTLVNVSDTSSIGISLYENEQQVLDAEEKFKEVMGGMMQFLTGPPEVSNGDEFWKFEL